MKALFEKAAGRLLNLLPTPIFLGLVTLLGLYCGFWVLKYRPELVLTNILLDPWFIAGSLIIVLLVAAYYVVRHLRARPRKTAPDRIGIWLAELEGDSKGSYLRDLKGQVEQELSSDPNLKNVEVRVYPEVVNDHGEARRVGTEYNAGAVVWGNLGSGLGRGRVSNLKLTIIGGPMELQNDVQFRSEVDLGGYEMRDVARFVSGYACLSSGKSAEAMACFDRILEDPRSGLFELADALQFGGIAAFLATQLSIDSRELLEKAKRYFTEYRDLWTEDRDPLPRAMGFYNLGLVQFTSGGDTSKGIGEALRLYGEAAKLFDKAGDDEGYAMVQLEVAHILSDLYQMQNEPAYGVRAHIYVEEVASIINKEENPYHYAKLMFERGRLLTRAGSGLSGIPFYYEQAVEAFEEAVELYSTGGYPVETAMALLHWGGARINMEDVGDEERQEVFETYRRASLIAPRERFPKSYATIQTSMCSVLLDLPATAPNVRAAIEAGKEALSIHTPEENAAEYARACICYAEACLVYASVEKLSDDDAMRYLDDAFQSAEAALKVVGPSFYPTYARGAEKIAEDVKQKIGERETEV